MSATPPPRGLPCYLTRYLSYFSGNLAGTTSFYTDSGTFEAAISACNAYDITTVPWGSTYNVAYGGEPDYPTNQGVIGTNTTQYWNQNAGVFLPSGLNQCVAFSAVRVDSSAGLGGNEAFPVWQIQRCQVLVFCGCSTDIAYFDWGSGGTPNNIFQPAPNNLAATSHTSGSVTASTTGTIISLNLPSDANMPIDYPLFPVQSDYYILSLGASYPY